MTGGLFNAAHVPTSQHFLWKAGTALFALRWQIKHRWQFSSLVCTCWPRERDLHLFGARDWRVCSRHQQALLSNPWVHTRASFPASETSPGWKSRCSYVLALAWAMACWDAVEISILRGFIGECEKERIIFERKVSGCYAIEILFLICNGSRPWFKCAFEIEIKIFVASLRIFTLYMYSIICRPVFFVQ